MAKKNTSSKKKGNDQKENNFKLFLSKKGRKETIGDGIVEYEEGITVGELSQKDWANTSQCH